MPASSTIVRNVSTIKTSPSTHTSAMMPAAARGTRVPLRVRRLRMYAVGERHEDQTIDQEQQSEQRNDGD